MVYQMAVYNHVFFADLNLVVFCCKSFNVHANICVCVCVFLCVTVSLGACISVCKLLKIVIGCKWTFVD